MEKYKPHIGDKIVGFIFKDKDLNTMQWFGKGMFVTEGEPWEFLVMSVIAFFIIVGGIMGIFSFLTGKS